MCGIYAYSAKQPNAGPIIWDALKHLEYRGYDSWGIALSLPKDLALHTNQTKDSHLWLKKQIGKLKDANTPRFPASHLGFGHTRWATHGGVTRQNAHPHFDCTKRFVVVHNGIIENATYLKNHLNTTHTFISATDTEVIAHSLEELATTQPVDQAVKQVTQSITGKNAFLILDTTTNTLYSYKNGSPLVIGKNGHDIAFASDIATLISKTPHIAYLPDHTLLKLSGHQITVLAGQPLTFETPAWKSPSTTQTYSHHMLQEIHDQPSVWRHIATSKTPVLTTLKSLISHHSSIFIIGCGSAGYAAQFGARLLTQHLNKLVLPVVASEFASYQLNVNRQSLIIALSQSGETRDTLDAVELAKAKGARIAGLVNVPGSSLERVSDLTLHLDTGPEVAVCSTKAYTAKLAWFLKLTGHAQELKQATTAFPEVRSQLNVNRSQLLTALNHSPGFVLGRGLGVPIALETALKIKEVSYLHYEAFPGGELKHGVIALIEKGTPVIIHCPHDEHLNHNLLSAQEVKARGAYVVGIGPKPHPVFDQFIKVPNIGIASWLLHTVVAQLMGYHLALARHLDPDMPRNLAKSVTVA